MDLVIFSGALKFARIERDNEYEIVKEFIFQEEIDGLIILSGAISEHYPIQEIKNIISPFHPMPMVSIAVEIPGIPSVIMDNAIGIRNLLHHLINDHGFTKIAFLKGPGDHDEAKIRFQTYKEILEQENIPFESNLVIEGSYFFEEAGEKAISKLLDQKKVSVDAIMAADDSIAVGALRSLKKRNIKVPEEIAVVGFDNLDKANSVFPSLTTVSQQFFKQGKKAVHALVKQLGNEEVEDVIRLSTSLIIRNSCGCKDPYDLPGNSRHDNLLETGIKKTISFLTEKLLNAINAGMSETFLHYLEKELIADFSKSKSLLYWQDVLSTIFI